MHTYNKGIKETAHEDRSGSTISMQDDGRHGCTYDHAAGTQQAAGTRPIMAAHGST